MNVADWLKLAEKRLTAAGISNGRLDAHLLAAHVLNKSRESVLAHDDSVISSGQQNQLDRLLKQRANRVPLAHLTGQIEFYGLSFEITSDVLSPRIETETMVELAIRYAPKGSGLIDVGTGSGALAIAIKKHRPDLHITATDISAKALLVAQRNAKRHAVQIEFIESDLWTGIEGRYTTIVTNLPYLSDEADLTPEVQYEPKIALLGGPDGLDLYRKFLTGVSDHLEPGGYLFTECDPWQQAGLKTAAARYHLKPIEESYFILGFQLLI